MRVYISADMEGISGISTYEDVDPSSSRFHRSVSLMEREIVHICEILHGLGINEIVINDAHWSMNNLRVENLPPYVRLISGSPKPLSMMHGIDMGFDACMFIGYHSAASTLHGHLAHTYSSKVIKCITINGKVASEALINGLVAAYFNVPVVLISGDDKLKSMEENNFPQTRFVITKYSVRYNSTLLIHPQKVFESYSKALKDALNSNIKPLNIPGELETLVEFKDVRFADISEICPYVVRVDSNTVRFNESDMLRAFKMLRTLISMVSH